MNSPPDNKCISEMNIIADIWIHTIYRKYEYELIVNEIVDGTFLQNILTLVGFTVWGVSFRNERILLEKLSSHGKFIRSSVKLNFKLWRETGFWLIL